MVKNASPILAALKAATQNETAAVEFLEAQRWGDTPACPRCGSVAVYRMMASDGGRNKDFRLRCSDCKKMFTVRTGTTFEESRLPLRVWVYCFWKACASKKGISALQLSREMEITHRSALFVLRRIRHGMTDLSTEKMTGTIEVDETYVGGKPRRKQNFRGTRRGNPSGTDKTPVVAMVQRDGTIRYRMMERVTAARLASVIERMQTCRAASSRTRALHTRRSAASLRAVTRRSNTVRVNTRVVTFTATPSRACSACSSAA